MEIDPPTSPKDIIAALILSTFDVDGPIPKVCFPEDMDYTNQLLVAMKSISLLMGEQVYQEGRLFDSIKYFGILPFPDLNYTALTYFFLIGDESARGKAKASTISLLVNDRNASFLYENMKQLSIYLAETANEISDQTDQEQYDVLMKSLLEKLQAYTANINAPLTSKRKLKILFTGLDASGKTSFLKAIRQKYSELIGIKPTKGIERSEHILLNSPLVEWDIGGQSKYRNNFLKQADFYLYDTNLLFFLIDVRDENRYKEALEFFGQIIKIFRAFKQFPPIVINLHKVDPDVEDEQEFVERIDNLQKDFINTADEFKLLFFKTSIFNSYSLIKAFSEGISSMSPNREIFKSQLKWLANELKAQSILLINENSIILSDFAVNETSSKVSELSAPHFHNLYRTFTEFKLLKRNNAVWHMDEDLILFYNININNMSLYLLCLMKDQEDIMKRFETLLPEFMERAKPLIEAYI